MMFFVVFIAEKMQTIVSNELTCMMSSNNNPQKCGHTKYILVWQQSENG